MEDEHQMDGDQADEQPWQEQDVHPVQPRDHVLAGEFRAEREQADVRPDHRDRQHDALRDPHSGAGEQAAADVEADVQGGVEGLRHPYAPERRVRPVVHHFAQRAYGRGSRGPEGRAGVFRGACEPFDPAWKRYSRWVDRPARRTGRHET
jgi:hypothetical protein